jgi:hypothetical protein
MPKKGEVIKKHPNKFSIGDRVYFNHPSSGMRTPCVGRIIKVQVTAWDTPTQPLQFRYTVEDRCNGGSGGNNWDLYEKDLFASSTQLRPVFEAELKRLEDIKFV